MAGKTMTEEQKTARKLKIQETKRLQAEAAKNKTIEGIRQSSREKCIQESSGTTPTYTYEVGELVQSKIC